MSQLVSNPRPPRYLFINGGILLATLCLAPNSHANEQQKHTQKQLVKLQLRGRASHLENRRSGTANKGQALSYRLRLNWAQAISHHTKATIEFDHIDTYWQARHGDGVRFNGKPPIPDAPSTQVNQAFIEFKSQELAASFGKKTLLLNNQRHIGSNGFWQDEQTFNRAHASYAFGLNSKATYYYINKAYRISGPHAGAKLAPSDINYTQLNGARPLNALGEHSLSGSIFNITTSVHDFHRFDVYGLFINNKTAPKLNHNTLGLNYHYKRRLDHWTPTIDAAIATQEQETTHSISYYQLKGSVQRNAWSVGFEREQLGSRQQTAFITPLASLHDFQGFADQFLTTPKNGLIDDIFHLKFKTQRIGIALAAHHFTSANQSNPSHNSFLGKELDITIEYRPYRSTLLELKYANFQAPQKAASTTQNVQRLFFTVTFKL